MKMLRWTLITRRPARLDVARSVLPLRQSLLLLLVISIVPSLAGAASTMPGSSQAKPIYVQVASPSPSPTPLGQVPAPCASPSGVLCFDRVPPTIIVLALSNDAATSVALSVEIANRFNRPHLRESPSPLYSSPVTFVAAPVTWGVADFVNACTAAPLSPSNVYVDGIGRPLKTGIAGALIVYSASAQNIMMNYVLFTKGLTRLDADAQFVSCTTLDKNHGGAVIAEPVGPVFDDLIGGGRNFSISLGPTAALSAALNAINTAKQTVTVKTYNYVPSPGPGVTSGPAYPVSYTTQSNGNYDERIVLTGAAISGLNNSSSLVFPGNNVPDQLKIAAKRLADDLFSRVSNCPAVTKTNDLAQLLQVDFGEFDRSVGNGRKQDPFKKPNIC